MAKTQSQLDEMCYDELLEEAKSLKGECSDYASMVFAELSARILYSTIP